MRTFKKFRKYIKKHKKKKISYSKLLVDYKSANVDSSLAIKLFCKEFDTRGNTQKSSNFFFKFLLAFKKLFLKKVLYYYKRKFYSRAYKYLKYYKNISNKFNTGIIFEDVPQVYTNKELSDYLHNTKANYLNKLAFDNYVLTSFFFNFKLKYFMFFQNNKTDLVLKKENNVLLLIEGQNVESNNLYNLIYNTFLTVSWKIDNTINIKEYKKVQKLNYLLLFLLYLIKKDKCTLDKKISFKKSFFYFLQFILQYSIKKDKKEFKKAINLLFSFCFLKQRIWSIYTIFKTTVWFNRSLVILKPQKKSGVIISVPFPLLRIKNQLAFFFKSFFHIFEFNFPKYRLQNGFFKIKEKQFFKVVVLEFFYLALFNRTKSLYLSQFQKKLKADLKINRGNLRFLRKIY